MQFDPPKNKGGGKWNRRWNLQSSRHKMPQLQILLILKSPFWGMYTVLQEQLQPMSDGKRLFIAESLLCYSYKLILISPGIFHRALFEKWLTLVAEKSPASAKITYSNLEAFNVHPPSYVILILKKMPFFIILLYPLPDKSPHLAAENLWILWK